MSTSCLSIPLWQLTQTTFGQFDAGSGVTVVARGAVVGVGTAALSSTDLYMAGGHGKAVIVAHVVGDLLWAMGSKAMPPYAVLGKENKPVSLPLFKTFCKPFSSAILILLSVIS